MNLQSLDLLHFFSRRFHGSCQEGERPARGRVVPRGDFAPMRSNNAERTLRPLWVKSRHPESSAGCPLYPRKRHQMRHIRRSHRLKRRLECLFRRKHVFPEPLAPAEAIIGPPPTRPALTPFLYACGESTSVRDGTNRGSGHVEIPRAITHTYLFVVLRAPLTGDMLKPEHYESWKELELTFDPKDM
jgi:hypothetical protein